MFFVKLFQFYLKFLSLFSVTGWKYNAWVDSFLNYIDNKMNKDQFFEKIDWGNLQAQLIVFGKPLQRKVTNPTEKTNIEAAVSMQREQ